MSESTNGSDQVARDQADRDQVRHDEQAARDQAAADVSAEQAAEAERLASARLVQEGAVGEAGPVVDATPAQPVSEEPSSQAPAEDVGSPVAETPATAAPPVAAPPSAENDHAEAPAASAEPRTEAPAPQSPQASEAGTPDAPVAGSTSEPDATNPKVTADRARTPPAPEGTLPAVEGARPVSDEFIRKTADDIMRSTGMGRLMDAAGGDAHVLIGGDGAASINLKNYIAGLRSAVEETLMEERARMRAVPEPQGMMTAAVAQAVAEKTGEPSPETTQLLVDAINKAAESAAIEQAQLSDAINKTVEAAAIEEAAQKAAASKSLRFGGVSANFSMPLSQATFSFGNAWQKGMSAAAEANAAEVERRQVLRASEPMAVRVEDAARPVGVFASMRDRLVSKTRAMSAAVSSALFTVSFKAQEFLQTPAARVARNSAMVLSLGAVAGTGLLHSVPWVADQLASITHAGGSLPTVNLHGTGATLHDHFASMGRAMAAQDVNSMAAPSAANHLTQYASLSNDTANRILGSVAKSAGVHFDFASMNLPSSHSPLYAGVDPGRFSIPSHLIDSGAVSLHGGQAGLTHIDLSNLSYAGQRPPMPDIMPDMRMAAIDPVNMAPGGHHGLTAGVAAPDHHGPAGGHHGAGGPGHHGAPVHDGKVSTSALNDLSLQDAKAGRTVTPDQIASLSGTPSTHHDAVALAAPHHGAGQHHGMTAAQSQASQDRLAAAAERHDVTGTAPAGKPVHQEALADIPKPAGQSGHATPSGSSFASLNGKDASDDGINMRFVGKGVQDIHKGINYASDGMRKFFGLDETPAPTPAPTPVNQVVPKPKGPQPF